jgi:hypothetical protein
MLTRRKLIVTAVAGMGGTVLSMAENAHSQVTEIELKAILDQAKQKLIGTREEVQKYFLSLTSPEKNEPNKNEQIGDKKEEVKNNGTQLETCTTVEYNLVANAEKLVTLNPDVASLWPGAIIQGTGYYDGIGSIRELPIKKRASINLNVDLLTRRNSIKVQIYRRQR